MKTLAEWRKYRPNKLAAGMNYTLERQRGRGHPPSTEANMLAVRGTTDVLASRWMLTRHTKCKCCGANTGPRALTGMGRSRLRRVRLARASKLVRENRKGEQS